MGSPSGIPAPTHQYHYNTNQRRLPAESGDALWALILDSPRESRRYLDALVALLSSDHEQKLLYALSDCFAIEQMLSILELVSVTHTRVPSTCALVPEAFRRGGVAGDQFKT